MKYARKLFALLLCLVMVMGLVTVASADDTYSITINNEAAGHTYEAYQIFTGTIGNAAENDNEAGTNATLARIQWGADVTDAGKTALLKFNGSNYNSPNELAMALNDQNAVAFSLAAGKAVDDTPTGTDDSVTDKKYEITGLVPGYYLVKDKDGSLDSDKNEAYTSYILEVVEDSTLSPKSSVPSSTKYVMDENDSTTGEDNPWQDSADYDIGDIVPFKIETTLANNVDSYAGKYKLVFQDTMQEGLTYNGDLKIYVDNELIYDQDEQSDNPEGITVSYVGTALTITIADAKDEDIRARNGSVITMLYSATLNEKAIHYETGNLNTVHLIYSNDPNWTPQGDGVENPDEPSDPDNPPTGKTPDSAVIVYTYKLGVDKVRENPEYDPETDKEEDLYIALKGAGFTLYKWNATSATEGTWVAVDAEKKGTDMTTFEWVGLDDGTYKLVETTTPPGYNTAEDVEFTITATHDLNGGTHVLNLSSNDERLTLKDDMLAMSVENKPGAVLPETGGIGTTAIYIIGGIMVLAAIVLLITKKRMSSAE